MRHFVEVKTESMCRRFVRQQVAQISRLNSDNLGDVQNYSPQSSSAWWSLSTSSPKLKRTCATAVAGWSDTAAAPTAAPTRKAALKPTRPPSPPRPPAATTGRAWSARLGPGRTLRTAAGLECLVIVMIVARKLRLACELSLASDVAAPREFDAVLYLGARRPPLAAPRHSYVCACLVVGAALLE